MNVTMNPTDEERAVLERLNVPDHVRAALQRPGTLTIAAEDAETVRDALTVELARTGFDAAYEPNVEGRLIEDLIDRLFIP